MLADSTALALGKRRAKLLLVRRAETRGRAGLVGHWSARIDQHKTVVAAATIAAYTVYTLTARDTSAPAVTFRLVVLGLFRYLLLLHRRSAGEEPENVLLGDVPILLTVAAWAATCAVILS